MIDTPVHCTMQVCAAYDELHRANRWTAARENDRSFRSRSIPATHAMMCLCLTSLRLDLDEAAWHGEGRDLVHLEESGGRSTCAEVKQPRARL